MSEQFVKKNVKLSLEFDNYLVKHLDMLDQIPDKSWIVLTINGDEDFNRDSISIARKSRSRRRFVEAHKSGRSWVVRPLELSK